jgi:hypothetical protein
MNCYFHYYSGSDILRFIFCPSSTELLPEFFYITLAAVLYYFVFYAVIPNLLLKKQRKNSTIIAYCFITNFILIALPIIVDAILTGHDIGDLCFMGFDYDRFENMRLVKCCRYVSVIVLVILGYRQWKEITNYKPKNKFLLLLCLLGILVVIYFVVIHLFLYVSGWSYIILVSCISNCF